MFVLHVPKSVYVNFLSAELHVFSGPEVSDQPVHSHTAGPHHSLPCTGSSGKTHALTSTRRHTPVYTLTQTNSQAGVHVFGIEEFEIPHACL